MIMRYCFGFSACIDTVLVFHVFHISFGFRGVFWEALGDAWDFVGSTWALSNHLGGEAPRGEAREQTIKHDVLW